MRFRILINSKSKSDFCPKLLPFIGNGTQSQPLNSDLDYLAVRWKLNLSHSLRQSFLLQRPRSERLFHMLQCIWAKEKCAHDDYHCTLNETTVACVGNRTNVAIFSRKCRRQLMISVQLLRMPRVHQR